jgi:hypothetical protein
MGSDVAAETLALVMPESKGTDGTVLARGRVGKYHSSAWACQQNVPGVGIIGESPIPLLLLVRRRSRQDGRRMRVVREGPTLRLYSVRLSVLRIRAQLNGGTDLLSGLAFSSRVY